MVAFPSEFQRFATVGHFFHVFSSSSRTFYLPTFVHTVCFFFSSFVRAAASKFNKKVPTLSRPPSDTRGGGYTQESPKNNAVVVAPEIVDLLRGFEHEGTSPSSAGKGVERIQAEPVIDMFAGFGDAAVAPPGGAFGERRSNINDKNGTDSFHSISGDITDTIHNSSNGWYSKVIIFLVIILVNISNNTSDKISNIMNNNIHRSKNKINNNSCSKVSNFSSNYTTGSKNNSRNCITNSIVIL